MWLLWLPNLAMGAGPVGSVHFPLSIVVRTTADVFGGPAVVTRQTPDAFGAPPIVVRTLVDTFGGPCQVVKNG
jgi:hypothetical protein